MSSRRSSVGVGVLGGLLYAVGGYDGASRHCLSSVECYNAVTKEWSLVCDMSTRRSGAGVGVSLFLTQEKLFSFLKDDCVQVISVEKPNQATLVEDYPCITVEERYFQPM